MSATEEWDDVYVDKDMGYLYRGGCSLHEHYLNETFKFETLLVNYFEPYQATKLAFDQQTKNLEPALLKAVAHDFGSDYLKNADDLEVHTVKYLLNPSLNIIHFNIGIGGGNGTHLFYLQSKHNNQQHYSKIAQTFDGEVTFCDEVVWIKK